MRRGWRCVRCASVLGDDLTRASADLAFADGARLADCLDLLRIPAPDLWVEWSDDVHQRVICENRPAADYDPAAAGRRGGGSEFCCRDRGMSWPRSQGPFGSMTPPPNARK
jgi:hypothetical protein